MRCNIASDKYKTATQDSIQQADRGDQISSECGGVVGPGGRSCFVIWYWQTVCYGTFCRMSMWGLGGVFNNTDAACGLNVWDRGECDSDDCFSRPHHSLQVLAVQLGAVSEPGGDAATQEALYSPSVESGENGEWEVGLLSLLRKWRRCRASFTVEPVLRDQVMFSARWTPRYLVFFTISTGEPWMFNGSWSLCALLTSTTISLVLSMNVNIYCTVDFT